MPKIIMASGPVIVRDNQVLLNQHGEDKFWKFCGGKAEDFELNLIETARKEFKEEMGAEFDVLDLTPYIFHAEAPGNKDVVLIHYLAGLVGEIKPGADIRQWGWFDVDKLPADLAPNIVPALVHFGYINDEEGDGVFFSNIKRLKKLIKK